MKKNILLLTLMSGLFTISAAEEISELKTKRPRVIIKSIVNHTPYDLGFVDAINDASFVVESQYKIDAPASLFAMQQEGVDEYGAVDRVRLFAMERISSTDLSRKNWLYISVDLMDHAIDEELSAVAKKEGDLFLYFGFTSLTQATLGRAQKIECVACDDIEIELIFYVDNRPELLKQFQFITDFRLLN